MYGTNAKLAFGNWKPPGRDSIIYDNILHVIGQTPLVKLNRITKDHGLDCEIYAKCEYENPGGSIKDRMAYTMVVDAENAGRAKPGITRFVEPTSGNTGIGLALTAAIKGYKTTIVTPDKNVGEKLDAIRLLGADIMLTPSSAKKGDPDHYMEVAKRIVENNKDCICLNQYENPVNPLTHMEHTAREIVDALQYVDMAVMGVGTGGTITGVAHMFRRCHEDCVIVAVDPKGSVIWGKELVPYYVEGIGGDFVPDVLDKVCVDKVVAPTDYDAFNTARELIRKEGLLCGGSSGAAMFAALKAAKELNLGAGKRVVVILPDGIRNYMTKFVCDQWMEAHLFKEPPVHAKIAWWNHDLTCLPVETLIPQIKTSATLQDAIVAMGLAYNVAIVVDKDGFFKGAISKNQLRQAASDPKKDENLNLHEPVKKHLIHNCFKVVENKGHPTVGLVSRILDITPFVVKVEKIPHPDDLDIETLKPKGIITSEMVWQYISKHMN